MNQAKVSDVEDLRSLSIMFLQLLSLVFCFVVPIGYIMNTFPMPIIVMELPQMNNIFYAIFFALFGYFSLGSIFFYTNKLQEGKNLRENFMWLTLIIVCPVTTMFLILLWVEINSLNISVFAVLIFSAAHIMAWFAIKMAK